MRSGTCSGSADGFGIAIFLTLKLVVFLLEGAQRRLPGRRPGRLCRHRDEGEPQVPPHALNTLVYTHWADYNAPHVGVRTVVRAPPGMCAHRRGRRGGPRLEPGPAGRRPGRRGRRAAPAPGDRRPNAGVTGLGDARPASPNAIGRRTAWFGAGRTPVDRGRGPLQPQAAG